MKVKVGLTINLTLGYGYLSRDAHPRLRNVDAVVSAVTCSSSRDTQQTVIATIVDGFFFFP